MPITIDRTNANDYFDYLTPLAKEGNKEPDFFDRLRVGFHRFIYLVTHFESIDDKKICVSIKPRDLNDPKVARLYDASLKRFDSHTKPDAAFKAAKTRIEKDGATPENLEEFHLSNAELRELARLLIRQSRDMDAAAQAKIEVDLLKNFGRYHLIKDDIRSLWHEEVINMAKSTIGTSLYSEGNGMDFLRAMKIVMFIPEQLDSLLKQGAFPNLNDEDKQLLQKLGANIDKPVNEIFTLIPTSLEKSKAREIKVFFMLDHLDQLAMTNDRIKAQEIVTLAALDADLAPWENEAIRSRFRIYFSDH